MRMVIEGLSEFAPQNQYTLSQLFIYTMAVNEFAITEDIYAHFHPGDEECNDICKNRPRFTREDLGGNWQ